MEKETFHVGVIARRKEENKNKQNEEKQAETIGVYELWNLLYLNDREAEGEVEAEAPEAVLFYGSRSRRSRDKFQWKRKQ